ncbi:gas vesicle protein [Streptomyces sp. MST-110588]|uniref:gas vesicle protein n=1 Tax=Streptomyces sp. MST-110588 TaxID=2833628 RepID=UPI001F5D207D|nr:gas vesicle protein [Streptomyces sp. MST-110588]UNO42866.1 gas vesicle protein [Streptomyces sp. MST-110588]
MTDVVTDHSPLAERQIALVDLLDRLLAGGAVIAGDITLRIAEVDLVRIDLRALISSVSAHVPSPFDPPQLPSPSEQSFDQSEQSEQSEEPRA